MGGVVADPEAVVVEDEAGITGVAAGGEGEGFFEAGGAWMHPAERGADGGVEAHGGEQASVGKADHVGAADAEAEVMPIPAGEGGGRGAEKGGIGLSVAPEEAQGGVAVEHQGGFVRITGVEEGGDQGGEGGAVGA